MPKARGNGTGTVRKVSDGVYQVRAQSGKDPVTGKYHQRSVTIHTTKKRDAEVALRQLLDEIAQRKVPATSENFAFAIDKWLQSRRTKQREGSTIKSYESKAKLVKEKLGHVPLATLEKEGRDILESFYAWLGTERRSPTTVQRYHAVINGSCGYAVERKWMAYNPALQTDRPSVQKPKLHVPSVEEVRELLHAANQHASYEWKVFLPLAVASWARRSELAALRWDNLDFVNGTMFIEASVDNSSGTAHRKERTKTHANRRISMDGDTMAMLEHYRQWQFDNRPDAHARGFLFASVQSVDEPVNPDLFTGWFKQTRKLAGLPKVRLHDIRHFGPTQALAAGVPLPQVSYRLGHAKISTTLDMYVDFIPERDRDVADFMGELMAPTTKELTE